MKTRYEILCWKPGAEIPTPEQLSSLVHDLGPLFAHLAHESPGKTAYLIRDGKHVVVATRVLKLGAIEGVLIKHNFFFEHVETPEQHAQVAA